MNGCLGCGRFLKLAPSTASPPTQRPGFPLLLVLLLIPSLPLPLPLPLTLPESQSRRSTSYLQQLLPTLLPALKRALLLSVTLAFVTLSPARIAAARTASPAASPAAATALPLPSCSWDSPGTNPYRGELATAVDRYTDIPAATRAALKARIDQRRYDDIAVIGRNHITGDWRYEAEIRDMHFGNGRLCRKVTRQRWPAQAEERGLVYCEGAHCVIVPTVCRNVSRVTRRDAVSKVGGTAAGNPVAAAGNGAAARQLTLLPENTELQFEAPAAGPTSGGGAGALAWTGPAAMTLAGPGSTAPGLVPMDGGADAAHAPATVAVPEPAAGAGSGSFNDGLTGAPAQPMSPLPPSGGGWGGLPTVVFDAPAAPVPEPATGLLMALGLAVLARRAAARHEAGRGS